jgi:DDE superfamily endonuclease
MLPLVSVPEFVHHYAQQYVDLFSPALREHFERYLAGLYVCERRNAQTINDAFVVQVKDQSSLNRFLTEYEWSTHELNERRLKLLRIDPQTRPRRSGVLPIDDTFNEKFGEHFAEIGYYYLPSEEYYAWAHNLVTLHYADEVCDYPLELALYEQMEVEEAVKLLEAHGGKYKPEVLARKKTDSAKRRYLWPKLRAVEELAERYPSKIQLACRLVDWAVEHGFSQPFVFDSWYTCQELCQHIRGREREWIGTTDASEGIYWGGHWQSLGEWVAGRAEREFDAVRFKYRGEPECYWAGSWVAQVGKLGRVRLVASHKEKDRSDKPKFYVASKLTWERTHILQRRRRRWTVETAYEDVKGPLGFDEYEVRDLEAIKRHWYLVFAAYSASRAATAHGRFGKWVNDRLLTIGDVCRQVQGEALAALISFCLTQTALGGSLEPVLQRVLSHLAR